MKKKKKKRRICNMYVTGNSYRLKGREGDMVSICNTVHVVVLLVLIVVNRKRFALINLRMR